MDQKEETKTKTPDSEKPKAEDKEVKKESAEADQKKPEQKEEKKEKTDQERIAELEKENADFARQIAVLKNEYAKAYADTENTRKRLTKENNDFMKYHIQAFATSILPVLDNCERALKSETKDEALHKGVEMIYKQLKAALEKEGVTEIDAEGKPFDGNWHQALMSEHKDGVEAGMVIEVLQKGYKLKDRLLRPAMVKVSE